MTFRGALIVALFVPVAATATSCPTYEYAELKEMTLDELLHARSEVSFQAYMTTNFRGRRDTDGTTRCDAERAKIDRMIKKREEELRGSNEAANQD